MEHEILSDSNSYIVKSMLFLLLVAFNEFALKQVYRVLPAPKPRLPPKGAVRIIMKTLAERKIVEDSPASYEHNFQRHIDPVRNNFAHGDWLELGRTLAAVELAKAFEAVAE